MIIPVGEFPERVVGYSSLCQIFASAAARGRVGGDSPGTRKFEDFADLIAQ